MKTIPVKELMVPLKAYATVSEKATLREAVLALQVGMAGLPEDQRQAIRLHVLEEKSLDAA